MREARLYQTSDWGEVRCRLCRHLCRIEEGQRGKCGVRQNRNGVLYTRLYGRYIVACPDPIEFLPLFHVAPGGAAYYVSALGLNFRRAAGHLFSPWEICRDAFPLFELEYGPSEIVAQALLGGSQAIAYSHTEPTIFYEAARDTMDEARRAGLLNVMQTNGYMTKETLEDAGDRIDAMNVSLWSLSEEFYEDYPKARLEGVLETLALIRGMGIWLEVTTILVPTVNDDPENIARTAGFLANELGPETPWHIGRHYPRLTEIGMAATDPAALRQARQIGLDEGLRHVYIRDTPGTDVNTTECADCSTVLIAREGGAITAFNLDQDRCPSCGHSPGGVKLDKVSV